MSDDKITEINPSAGGGKPKTAASILKEIHTSKLGRKAAELKAFLEKKVAEKEGHEKNVALVQAEIDKAIREYEAETGAK